MYDVCSYTIQSMQIPLSNNMELNTQLATLKLYVINSFQKDVSGPLLEREFDFILIKATTCYK